MHLDPLGDSRLFSAFCARRTYHPWDNHRCHHHAGVHRGQCVFRSQGGSDVFNVDSSGGYFDGDPARLPGRDRSGKQHRANRCVRRGNAVVDYFRVAGSDHDRLVDWFSILDFFRDLRVGRDFGRDVLNSPPPRVGHDFRLAVSRRCRLRRGAKSGQ